ncbi:MAG: OsmC family protein [Vicinamibacteria bacterium]|jgi:uncharacterized OsmC-like protein
MDLRERQAPLKEGYRERPEDARISLSARGSETGEAVACSVDLGRLVQQAEAHGGVGGPGTGACSGDLLLGALAACAQITCQMVAAATGIETERIEAIAEGEIDLRGTLGIDREAPVGFESIRLRLEVEAPNATAEELEGLHARTERYCTVLQTLLEPPPIETSLVAI